MTGHKINLHFTLCSLPLSTYRSGWPPLIWSNKTEIEMWGGAALLLLISLRAIRASVHVPSTPPQHLLRLRLFGGLSIILMQFKDLHSTPELPWQQSPPPHTPTPPTPPPVDKQKGSSSVMVPEASPLSIDLLSPNFSVTYALLNSHYCAHWSLIRGNNRLVVTEGQKIWARLWQCECKLMTSTPRSPLGDLYAPRVRPASEHPALEY